MTDPAHTCKQVYVVTIDYGTCPSDHWTEVSGVFSSLLDAVAYVERVANTRTDGQRKKRTRKVAFEKWDTGSWRWGDWMIEEFSMVSSTAENGR